jgi:antitoxin component YwqK of YwqJK toxin-antitoxin module
MKNIFFLFTLILLFPILVGCQQEKQNPEVEVKETYYKNGTISSRTEYVNGVREGWHRVYAEDGTLVSEVNFVNGKMEGQLKAYYIDGAMKMIANYKNGVLEGETTSFFTNGKIRAIQKYEKNKLVYHKQFDIEGNVEFEESY